MTHRVTLVARLNDLMAVRCSKDTYRINDKAGSTRINPVIETEFDEYIER